MHEERPADPSVSQRLQQEIAAGTTVIAKVARTGFVVTLGSSILIAETALRSVACAAGAVTRQLSSLNRSVTDTASSLWSRGSPRSWIQSRPSGPEG
jgi:hypothetical protein